MKRLMHIFMSATLSLMIILMGSGMLSVHCNHTGTTRVLMSHNHACAKKCKTTSKCMTVKILKLSTMNQHVPTTLEHKLPVSFLPWLAKPLFELKELNTTTTNAVQRVCNPRYGPPREYLRRICILLI